MIPSPGRSNRAADAQDRAALSANGLLARHFEPTLAAEVLSWQPQIVHFHSVHIPQNVALAAHLRRMGRHIASRCTAALFPAALRRRRVKKTHFQSDVRASVPERRGVHPGASPHEVDSIRRYGVTTPVVVIPNGLPPHAELPPSRPHALFEANPSLKGRRIFMFVGRLDPWQKGLDLLIEAFARADCARPPWSWWARTGSAPRLRCHRSRHALGSRRR